MKAFAIPVAAFLLACAGATHAQDNNSALGQFDQQLDIGDTAFAGEATFKDDTYRITASGANIWGTADAFHYVAKPASGDLSFAADIAFEGQGTDPHRKAGLMLRQSLAADAPYVDIMLHGDGMVALQYREVAGGPTHDITSNIRGATRVQLEYHGGYAWMSVAGADGILHHAGGGFPIRLQGSYFAGLAVSAHNNTLSETANFKNIAIAALPAAIAPTPQTKVESTLEILALGRRDRTVVYHTTDHIEAPNWMPDGQRLLFNSKGLIYTLPITGGTPTQIDTGSRVTANNDHGISPDGKDLVISDQTNADRQSRLYILPITGGEPREITPQGPSYWHGWSPDGKTLAYIANRNGDYDVYSIPVTGGIETRLTTTPGLDDGSEYSPDGQWIYYNSVRSGNMKLWRMHADGSGAEQLTFGDETRDWFPHPSPDGKWIAYISFGSDVAVGDHPANKNVSLRLMPANGGEPEVIARLFGGQGTINVPSWAPDSKSLAFVSYRPVAGEK